MNENNEKFITLGNCSNMLLTMLGDFCSKNGLDAKAQKDYRDETTKYAFGKYNLTSKNSKLAQLIIEFNKTLAEKYKFLPLIGNYLLSFPDFLQSSIKFIDNRIYDYVDTQVIITFLLVNYIAFYYAESDTAKKKKIIDAIEIHATNTYSDLLKNMKFSKKEISEEANWSTIEELLKEAKNCYSDERERFVDCAFLTDHYIYLGFKKALMQCFNYKYIQLMELEKYLLQKINLLSNVQKYYLNKPEAQKIAEDFILDKYKPEILYSLLNVENPYDNYLLKSIFDDNEFTKKELEVETKHFNEVFAPGIKNEAVNYFINTYTQLSEEKTNEYLNTLESLNDDYYKNILIPMYKARALIFSLTWTDKNKDKEIKKEACNLYKQIFENHKYEIGLNLQEFLSDAIACDVYCNPKKDIFSNSQDNTEESSVTMPGKAYWEFGYALGIFPEDSKKTYLLTYNMEENFWTNFPPSKFINQKEALKAFYKETRNSEYELPVLIDEFKDEEKIKNLESTERKDSRQPLGSRYYSNFTIRCLKAKDFKKDKNGLCEFSFIHNFIKKNSAEPETLFINDENGANALIRSLDRYKMLTYGFTDDAIVERSKILTEFSVDYFQKPYELIIQKFSDCELDQPKDSEEIVGRQEECCSKYFIQLGELYNKQITKTKTEKDEINILKNTIKENIILPLIECGKNHLLDEAISLGGRKCVSALQLAIDSYDFDIVKKLLDAMPEGTDLANTLISNEYVTPLQYAIRKYDYLMQYAEMLIQKKIHPIIKRDIKEKKETDKGVLILDQNYYSMNNAISDFIDDHPFEECGLYLMPCKNENEDIHFEQQKNLIETIKLLAEKTNPISVSTFYYLADQVDPKDGKMFSDVLDLVHILINTGHAQLAGTGFEDEPFSLIPSQTLIAYCINHSSKDYTKPQKNYDLLSLLLSEYAEEFKDIINEKIQGYDNDGNYRYDTDLHFFISNMIENIKIYSKHPMLYKNYEKETAWRMNYFLKLFYKAGARFDIPDQNNKTALDYLKEWHPKMPKDAIPEEILKKMNN